MKQPIKHFKFAEYAVKKTLVVAAKNGDKTNIMTLGWKTLGTLWSIPVWIIAVKPSRYTYELLNNHQEFTLHAFPRSRADVVDLAGSLSGRNVDKIAELGLTLEKSRHVSVPLIKEASLSYECKIIHTAESGDITDHRLFFGEILAAYADKEIIEKKK